MPREYIDLIKTALEAIEPDYYRLVTTYDRNGIVRERVFCYELYHQMRLRVQPDQILSIHGEIDKRGHRDFEPEDRKNPDFVFHVQGTHDFNTLVIEVKGTLDYDIAQERRRNRLVEVRPNQSEGRIRRQTSTAVSDMQNLLLFVAHYSYRAGVFILYNHTFEEFYETVGHRLRELREVPNTERLHILTINLANRQCEEHILHNV